MPAQDLGYDQFFDKSVALRGDNIPAIDSGVILEGITGADILSSGTVRSQSGRLEMSLDGESFIVNDGTVERVRLGQMEDGEYGLRIQDKEGNVLFNITGVKNIIQGSDQRMQIDLTKRQLRVYDDKNLRVIIGEF